MYIIAACILCSCVRVRYTSAAHNNGTVLLYCCPEYNPLYTITPHLNSSKIPRSFLNVIYSENAPSRLPAIQYTKSSLYDIIVLYTYGAVIAICVHCLYNIIYNILLLYSWRVRYKLNWDAGYTKPERLKFTKIKFYFILKDRYYGIIKTKLQASYFKKILSIITR